MYDLFSDHGAGHTGIGLLEANERTEPIDISETELVKPDKRISTLKISGFDRILYLTVKVVVLIVPNFFRNTF